MNDDELDKKLDDALDNLTEKELIDNFISASMDDNLGWYGLFNEDDDLDPDEDNFYGTGKK